MNNLILVLVTIVLPLVLILIGRIIIKACRNSSLVQLCKAITVKHPKTTFVLIGVVLFVLIIGTLSIVDILQREERESTSVKVDIDSYTELPAFDVTGLTDEEIEKYLEEYRKNAGK